MYAVTPPEHAFTWWSVLVDVLAVARITRLLTKDTLPPIKSRREALLRRMRGSGWASIAVCPWCLGFHIAVLVFGLHVLLAFTLGPTAVGIYALILAPWAISYVAGFLAEFEGS